MSGRIGAPVGRNEVETFYALGKRIRELRHRKGWSQETLALMACVHKDQIGRFERGTEVPPLRTIAWIAMAFGIDNMGEFLEHIKPEDLI